MSKSPSHKQQLPRAPQRPDALFHGPGTPAPHPGRCRAGVPGPRVARRKAIPSKFPRQSEPCH